MIEEWRPVKDWPYEVSSEGRVRRAETGRIRSPILMKSTGYLMVSMTRPNGDRLMAAIHRLVAFAFLGEPPHPDMQVNHKDSDRANPKLDNLEWATISENILHGYRQGACNATGSANGYSKLTDEAVIAIRSEASSDRSNFVALAAKFNVSKATIYDVVKGRTWTHLRVA
ncbi:NUMOD4 motif-containing HNH endonuclease [Allorhizobium sp. BGMRC 0089]|uniref:HNH endonuclease n=1 Tax=Allorhizobium sonneratiae TaxID=2934936 RepID=UPI0020341058|nr:HNH endonuclease [Allorhizobium sonneratiae]MCM2293047.1 NUMOD4 motif-containing HNH endonuclease [Allorhizobium sonneratiae]